MGKWWRKDTRIKSGSVARSLFCFRISFKWKSKSFKHQTRVWPLANEHRTGGGYQGSQERGNNGGGGGGYYNNGGGQERSNGTSYGRGGRGGGGPGSYAPRPNNGGGGYRGGPRGAPRGGAGGPPRGGGGGGYNQERTNWFRHRRSLALAPSLPPSFHCCVCTCFLAGTRRCVYLLCIHEPRI